MHVIIVVLGLAALFGGGTYAAMEKNRIVQEVVVSEGSTGIEAQTEPLEEQVSTPPPPPLVESSVEISLPTAQIVQEAVVVQAPVPHTGLLDETTSEREQDADRTREPSRTRVTEEKTPDACKAQVDEFDALILAVEQEALLYTQQGPLLLANFPRHEIEKRMADRAAYYERSVKAVERQKADYIALCTKSGV